MPLSGERCGQRPEGEHREFSVRCSAGLALALVVVLQPLAEHEVRASLLKRRTLEQLVAVADKAAGIPTATDPLSFAEPPDLELATTPDRAESVRAQVTAPYPDCPLSLETGSRHCANASARLRRASADASLLRAGRAPPA